MASFLSYGCRISLIPRHLRRKRESLYTLHGYLCTCVKNNLIFPVYHNPIQYLSSGEIRPGHRATDYLVHFIPLYTHNDMFKTTDNFGYTFFTTTPYYSQAFFTQRLVNNYSYIRVAMSSFIIYHHAGNAQSFGSKVKQANSG